MVQLNSFRKILAQADSAYLDTNVLIYHLEEVPPYAELTGQLFEMIEEGGLKGFTSTLSILELNVGPYQLNRPELSLTYMALLKNLPNFSIQSLSIDTADSAAKLRAKYRFKTPDSIHLATALETRCHVMIGNDKAMKRITEIEYIYFRSFL